MRMIIMVNPKLMVTTRTTMITAATMIMEEEMKEANTIDNLRYLRFFF